MSWVVLCTLLEHDKGLKITLASLQTKLLKILITPPRSFSFSSLYLTGPTFLLKCSFLVVAHSFLQNLITESCGSVLRETRWFTSVWACESKAGIGRLPYKEPDSEYSSAGHQSLSQLWPCWHSTKAVPGNPEHRSMAGSKKTSRTLKLEFHVIFTCHEIVFF